MAIPTYKTPPPHPSRGEGSDQLAFNQKAELWLDWVFDFFSNGGKFREILRWISQQLTTINREAVDVRRNAEQTAKDKSIAVTAKDETVSAWRKIQGYTIPTETAYRVSEIDKIDEAHLENYLNLKHIQLMIETNN